MNRNRYILEPYKGMKSRYDCPGCGKQKTFTRYIDTETGRHIAGNVGRCSREINCGYHYTPRQYFEANKPLIEKGRKPEFSCIVKKKRKLEELEPIKREMLTNVDISLIGKQVSFIPGSLFKQSLSRYSENNFVQYLIGLVGASLASEAVSRYFIGTSKHQFKRQDHPGYLSKRGATVFWQIDGKGKVRTGKIMLYSSATGKRIKEPFNHIHWAHSVLKLSPFHLQQCFFGEHLLKREPLKPVAIAESEKTAIIGSIYLPRFIWLGCGSLSSLTAKKCQVFLGRNVVLFPDLNAFDKWSNKARELSRIARFTVSDLLERKATAKERAEGLDLADYLIRFPVRAFQESPLHIHTSDIAGLVESKPSATEFNKFIKQGLKSKDGKVYELLFDAEGELIKPGEQGEAVERLASFFEKNLQPAFFDNKPCLVHIVNP